MKDQNDVGHVRRRCPEAVVVFECCGRPWLVVRTRLEVLPTVAVGPRKRTSLAIKYHIARA